MSAALANSKPSPHTDGFGPRILEFAQAFAARFVPGLGPEEVVKAAREILDELSTHNAAPSVTPIAPAAAAAAAKAPTSGSPANPGFLQLSFRHTCLALGCKDSECTLCQYNPVRLCARNFGKKYLVGDVLRATCGAPIKVDIKSTNGQRYEADLPGVAFEVSLLDGVTYKEKGGEVRQLPLEELRTCIKFTNHRDEALLQPKSGMSGTNRKIIMKAERGMLQLPELQVTDSSEALLTGRKPPFRLIVVAVGEDGQPLPSWGYAVSEEFVVATRRVKQANKAEIPLMDDHVSKIEHIGRETVKKLADMHSASAEIGMVMQVPSNLLSVSTVGQFVKLVELAEKDAQLKKVLQVVLKLSKEKWEEAAAHALTAVVSDFRRRVWYPPGHGMSVGVLFSSKYGAVQLKDPVALLQQVPSGNGGNGGLTTFRASREDELDPASLTHLRQLKQQAVNCWWSPGHPGWCIFKEQGEQQGLGGGAAAVAPGLSLDMSTGSQHGGKPSGSALTTANLIGHVLDSAASPTLTITALNTTLQQQQQQHNAAVAAAAAAGNAAAGGLPALAPLHVGQLLQHVQAQAAAQQAQQQNAAAAAAAAANPPAAMAAGQGVVNRASSFPLDLLLQQAAAAAAVQQQQHQHAGGSQHGTSTPKHEPDVDMHDQQQQQQMLQAPAQRSPKHRLACCSSPGDPHSHGSSPLHRNQSGGNSASEHPAAEDDANHNTLQDMVGAKRRRSNSSSGGAPPPPASNGHVQSSSVSASRAGSLSLDALGAVAAAAAAGGDALKEWGLQQEPTAPDASPKSSAAAVAALTQAAGAAGGNGQQGNGGLAAILAQAGLPSSLVYLLPSQQQQQQQAAASASSQVQQLAQAALASPNAQQQLLLALLAGQQQQQQQAVAAAAAAQPSAAAALLELARSAGAAAPASGATNGISQQQAAGLLSLLGLSVTPEPAAPALQPTAADVSAAGALAALSGLLAGPSGANGLASALGGAGVGGVSSLNPAALSQLMCLSQLAGKGL